MSVQKTEPGRAAATKDANSGYRNPWRPQGAGHRPGRTVQLSLVAYGVVVAVLAALSIHADLNGPMTLMGTRDSGIRASIAVLDRGGPPLLGSKRPYKGAETEPRRDYYPVGVTDDQGAYLYLPELAQILGSTNPEAMLRLLYISCFAFWLALCPLLFYELLDSIPAATAAPLLGWAGTRYLENTDIYWIAAWVLLLGIPVVWVAHRRPWGRLTIVFLVAASFVGSFASSIRLHSGLPVEVAALVVLMLKRPGWRTGGAAAVAIVVASLSLSTFLMSAVRYHRDATVGIPFRQEFPSQHPVWHNAYIGLGYAPNPYGIVWKDSVAIDAARKANPKAIWPSPQYGTTLRHLYLHLLFHHPGFVLKGYWAKFGAIVRDGFHRFWLLLLVVPAIFLFAPRTHLRAYVLLAVPAVVLGALPPILTIPAKQYETGWLGALNVLWMLGLLWAVAIVARGVTAALSRRAGASNFRTMELRTALPGRRTLAAFFACTAAFLGAGVAAAEYRIPGAVPGLRTPLTESAFYRAGATPPLPAAARVGQTVADWRFNGHVPHEWAQLRGTNVRPLADGLEVSTTDKPNAYQLLSPTVRLPAGSYIVAARAAVKAGGIQIGILNADKNAWILSGLYWWAQRVDGKRLGVSFSLDTPTSVQVILANWVPRPRSSSWLLRRITLSKRGS